MPLIKSAKSAAVGANIKLEQSAGKPKKQAVAIALNTQRKAAGMSNRQIAQQLSVKAFRERNK
jgi:hypothetical protein